MYDRYFWSKKKITTHAHNKDFAVHMQGKNFDSTKIGIPDMIPILQTKDNKGPWSHPVGVKSMKRCA